MHCAKHTPGPWSIGPVDDTVVNHLGLDGVRRDIAAIAGDYNDPDLWPVMEANARLIAAAPDLLKALEQAAVQFVLLASGYGDAQQFEAEALAAIAKAA
jgi:hypothetical protein